jgi:hypothetical protein
LHNPKQISILILVSREITTNFEYIKTNIHANIHIIGGESAGMSDENVQFISGTNLNPRAGSATKISQVLIGLYASAERILNRRIKIPTDIHIKISAKLIIYFFI